MAGVSHMTTGRRYPVGAEFAPDGRVHFRVWAPKCHRVDLVLQEPGSTVCSLEMTPEESGYYSGSSASAAGTSYWFRLNGNDPLFADPASRFQPQGPEGRSEIIDPSGFQWTDHDWPGVRINGQVIYEMHVGTFTPAGTWRGAAAELAELADLGVTVIEMMPIHEFHGRFGWSYDGVNLFAPSRVYGEPDDLRYFVDRAHAVGLGVILDVVYNHFGSVANYLNEFSDDYVTDRYQNDWNEAINFDGDNSGPVRDFIISNALYWIEEFHFDGFRIDATQSIHDRGSRHILNVITEEARRAAGMRSIIVLAENEPQQARMIRPANAGGHGMDAAVNDDFHHSATVRLTGHNEAYYTDYRGSPEEFIASIKWGYLYQGQYYSWQKKPRGTPTVGLPAAAFVNYLQSHDQIANSVRGERIDRMTSPGRLRAMTALLLLSPGTPMLFQGQEFAASTPFLYFADNSGQQAQRVAAGRMKFLKQFRSFATPEVAHELSDPADEHTFRRCKLDFSERKLHAPMYRLHQDLLRLRRTDLHFRAQDPRQIDGAALSADCLLVRFFMVGCDERLLLVNFGLDLLLSPAPQPLLAPPEGSTWELLWSSEDPRYGGSGTASLETEQTWRIPGEAAIVLSSRQQPHST